MTEEQIKHMVRRFLGWRLPEHFRPDAGISFKAEFNDSAAVMAMLGLDKPMRHEPTGTNLFDATQADAMVRYMVEGISADPHSDRAEHCPDCGTVIIQACPKCAGMKLAIEPAWRDVPVTAGMLVDALDQGRTKAFGFTHYLAEAIQRAAEAKTP